MNLPLSTQALVVETITSNARKSIAVAAIVGVGMFG